MTTLLERFQLQSADESDENISIPESAEEIDKLQAELLATGNELREQPNTEPKVKEEIIHRLAQGVVRLAISPAEDYRKVLVASEVAADVASVIDVTNPVIEIAQELIDDRYSKPSGHKDIDELNRESREALLLAIHETNPDTPFSTALAESSAEVDQQLGRSFARDVIEPTSIAVTVKQEQRAALEARKKRIEAAKEAGNYDYDDTETLQIDMSQYLQDDYEDEEKPFNRREAEKHISFTTFRKILADEDNERVLKATELASIRSEIEAFHRQAA